MGRGPGGYPKSDVTFIVKGCEFMNAGYVRLSRDDDRKNYSSIENQKLIITQYAAEQNLTIDRWYEDDGFSGYLFVGVR